MIIHKSRTIFRSQFLERIPSKLFRATAVPTSWGTHLGQPHAIFGPPQRNQPRPAMLELFGVGCPVDQIMNILKI